MLNRVMGQLHDNGVNPKLELLGVVMTMFDGRTKLSQQVVGEVRQHFGERVFETMIPRSTRLAEAPSFGKPIIHYDKFSTGAAAYERSVSVPDALAKASSVVLNFGEGTAVDPKSERQAPNGMRAWLERLGSPIQLVDLGRRCYALHIAEGATPAVPEQPTAQ